MFMNTLSEIESAVNNLTLTELMEVERVVRRELEERRNTNSSAGSAPSRVLGLHPGAWSVMEDFDAPLSDEFWLGKGS